MVENTEQHIASAFGLWTCCHNVTVTDPITNESSTKKCSEKCKPGYGHLAFKYFVEKTLADYKLANSECQDYQYPDYETDPKSHHLRFENQENDKCELNNDKCLLKRPKKADVTMPSVAVHVPFVAEDPNNEIKEKNIEQVQWFIENIGSVYMEFELSAEFLIHTTYHSDKVFVKDPP